ncbi:ABC transporter permease [Aquamicrobium defluvii]|uniref:ABC transporter permease n=1 Tax=Aquamicrobium defluvii TaxID=69279 RepID=A0A011TFH7_9HYPH|nr:ABC transporter permease [Aquamicrobium defluvii]EZQ17556.1 ABC transporter permease [Halopseudomonas bauzanensis]
MPANRPMTLAEWATLLFLSLLWGGSFFFNAVAVKELPVFTVVVGRVAVAAVLMLCLLRVMGLKLPGQRRIWAAFFGIGLLNNAIPFSLIVGGQQHIASGVASILNAATPLFTVLFAHFLTADEKMTGNRLAGVLVGFVGVAVMVGLDAVQALGSHVTAQLMCLSATVSYALASIYGRRFRAMGVPALVTATGQVVAASVLLVPVMLLVDRPWTLPMPGLAALGAVAGLAVLSTALAYVLYFRLLATAGASNLALVTFLVPVSAILLGFLFLDEVLLPRHLAGMALIGLGLAAIDGRSWRAIRRRGSWLAAGRR